MTVQEYLQWAGLIVAWIGYSAYSYTLTKRIKYNESKLRLLSTAYSSAIKLIMTEIKRKDEHTKALKRLTDPESILEDMEKGARMREMYDANRITLPRENAGPPAKVYSTKLRANTPRSQYKPSDK